MPERSVVHATFTIERTFARPPARVFAAWADPSLKARWFDGGTGTQLTYAEDGAFLDGLDDPELRKNDRRHAR